MKFEIAGNTAFAGCGHVEFDAAQPTIVFIHGAGLDHTVWHVFERYFVRHGFNVLSLDLPGHGRSGGDPLTSIGAMADWVNDVLRQHKVERAVVIGHSMGSLVALESAARGPDIINKVVLIGFSLPMAVGPPLLDAARENDSAAIDMMVIYGHGYSAQIGGNRVSGVSVINSAKRLLERNAPGVLFADLNACNEYAGPSSLESITCPVVLISGSEDKMTPPRAALDMARQLENGSALIFEDCGHGVMAEKPEQLHRALVDTLTTVTLA